MKRRGEQTPAKAPEGQEKRERYSVRPYIIILFVAVILLMLLSYYTQQRRSNATIDSMTESHSAFSIEALANIEALQNSNILLTEQVADLEKENQALTAQVADLEKAAADAETEKKKAQAEAVKAAEQADVNAALTNLYHAVFAADEANIPTARAAVEALKDRLDADQLAMYEEIITYLDTLEEGEEEQ